MLKGRQVLRMMYESYAVNASISQVFRCSHLYSLQWPGDDKMRSFYNDWKYVLSGIKKKPDPEELEEMMYLQLQKSKVLIPALEYYDRVGVGHEDHTYKYLIESIERHLRRTETAKNVAGLATATGVGNIAGRASGGKGANSAPAPGVECPFWLKGYCKNGDACLGKHTPALKGTQKKPGKGDSKGAPKGNPKSKGKGDGAAKKGADGKIP